MLRDILCEYGWEIAECAVALALAALVTAIILKRNKPKKYIAPAVLFLVIALCAHLGLAHYFNAPDFEVEGGERQITEVYEEFVAPSASVFAYNGKKVPVNFSIDGEVDNTRLGEYELIYNYEYRYRSYSFPVIITVIDDIAPVIELSGNWLPVVERFSEYSESGCTAIDNYDGDVSESVDISYMGDYESEVTAYYRVTDSSGNTAEKTRVITIRDTTPPLIKLKGYSTEYLVVGNEYVESGATVNDNVDGDITSLLRIKGEPKIDKIGEYNIDYYASDAAGNTGYASRSVHVVSREAVSGNVIYLTFDDGPSENTIKILDILKKNKIKATFFIINFETDEEKAIIKRMVDEGHTVGIHGYSHDYNKIYASEEAFMTNIKLLQNKVFELTGYKANIIRFPGGSSNMVSSFNPGIMSRLVLRVREEGFLYFDWNVDSGDASGSGVPSSRLVKNVSSGLRKGRGNVVLMHDSAAKGTTVNALDGIIYYANKQGYVFSNITEATKPVRHSVAN